MGFVMKFDILISEVIFRWRRWKILSFPAHLIIRSLHSKNYLLIHALLVHRYLPCHLLLRWLHLFTLLSHPLMRGYLFENFPHTLILVVLDIQLCAHFSVYSTFCSITSVQNSSYEVTTPRRMDSIAITYGEYMRH